MPTITITAGNQLGNLKFIDNWNLIQNNYSQSGIPPNTLIEHIFNEPINNCRIISLKLTLPLNQQQYEEEKKPFLHLGRLAILGIISSFSDVFSNLDISRLTLTPKQKINYEKVLSITSSNLSSVKIYFYLNKYSFLK